MYAVIRVRGRAGTKKEIEDTLKMLRLKAVNNCVLVPETDSIKGMLEKVKDFITWGEIDLDTLVLLLKRRLRGLGDVRIDNEEKLKEYTGYDSFEQFAKDLIEGKIKLKQFEKLKKVFRLPPPSKGYKSIKLHYPKGDLGYRGKTINELLKRML
ncbi:MAG: 50S ribosomal protein L30 [Candidatus Aenigmarchaeota archaeon ex4484_224]|nr:MAG: 50S ribosomal protein L30 [Candidatus Aenigmarchaeota archaeon ex4484_224]